MLRTPSKNKKNLFSLLVQSIRFTKIKLHSIITITHSQSNKRGDIMVKNNIEFDVKVKLLEENITQSDLADTLGTTRQQINRVVNKDSVVNKSFVGVMEALGYDIVLTYVPRE
nr:MAG TPA: Regulatory protein [Caudoviricetes sp.]